RTNGTFRRWRGGPSASDGIDAHKTPRRSIELPCRLATPTNHEKRPSPALLRRAPSPAAAGEGEFRLFFLASPAAAGEDGERSEPSEGPPSNFWGQRQT
ncbi:MAG: hypothetical protein KGM47_10275, partial [Acidobacteriota bacterium]|nr:hypothetical protein [Acidobacteriota bacterium]